MNATQLLEHFDRLAEAPDAVPRLRRFILDLAVRGKLVAQDAGDEPAVELIKLIQSGKAKRIKLGEVRNPRDLVFPEGEAPPFLLPPFWNWVRLADVGAIVGGGTPPAGDLDNFTEGGKGIGWLTPADLGKHKGIFVSHGIRDLTEAGMKAGSATLMPKGSVLFTSRAPIGYVAIAANDISTNQGFKSVVPYLDECSRYIATYLQAFGPQIDSQATGTTFKEVSGKVVAGLPFPLPPLAEQHRIVAKVDELMTLCDQLEAAQQERERRRDRLVTASLQRLNHPAADTTPETQREHARFYLDHLARLTTRPEHIKAMREVVLDAAFQGTLTSQDPADGTGKDLVEKVLQLSLSAESRGKKTNKRAAPTATPDVEPAFPTPAVWGWADLQMLCEQIGDIDHKMPRAVDVGVPFLSARDLKDGGLLDFSNPKYISEEDFTRLSRKVLPKRNDIIYSRIGARLGKARLVEVDTRFLISYSCCLIRPKHEFIDKRYLQIFLDSHLALQQAHSGVQSIGVPDLGLGEIKAYRIPVPPLAEQHRIVAKVDELMALCDQLEAQLTTTQTDSRRLLEAVLEAALAPA